LRFFYLNNMDSSHRRGNVNFILNNTNLSPPKPHSLLQTSTFSGVSALNTQNLSLPTGSNSSLSNYEVAAGSILSNLKTVPTVINNSFTSNFPNSVFSTGIGCSSPTQNKTPSQFSKSNNTLINNFTNITLPLNHKISFGVNGNSSPVNSPSTSPSPMNSNNSNNSNIRHCAHCKTTVTPLWRKGWTLNTNSKPVSLCNACGIRYSKNQFCPYCYYIYNKLEEPYNADERRPDLLAPNRSIPTWIRCELCFRWVHFKCEAEKQRQDKQVQKYTNGEWPSVFDKMDLDDHPLLSPEEEHQFLLTVQHSYKCPTCRIPGASIVFNYPTPNDFKSHNILNSRPHDTQL
jgi:hypothetical protein